jgi:NADH:ubiquinone oxidoreductase subunit H
MFILFLSKESFNPFSFIIIYLKSVILWFKNLSSIVSLTLEFISLSLVIILPLIIAVAYYTLAERKVMAAIQRRKGPNVVGFWGLLQPLADGLKLIVKEMVIPRKSNIIVFILSPIITFILSLLT